MFAPYCPTCGHRVLLGTGRVLAANLGIKPAHVLLRCYCGTAVRHDSAPPQARHHTERLAG
jgi:hypothetical protein